MKAKILLFTVVFCSPFLVRAQIGAKLMGQMNAYLQTYGGDNVSKMKYNAASGFVSQTAFGYTENYKLSDIKRIEVSKAQESFVVQFFCDEKDPCISQSSKMAMGKYLPSVAYFFSQEGAANSFAKKASEIISTDFKGKPTLKLTKESKAKLAIVNDPKEGEVILHKEPDVLVVKKDVPPPQKVKKKKKVVDHLSISSYEDDTRAGEAIKLSTFGKKLNGILQLAINHQLARLKGPKVEGLDASTTKLPKAKKNYINKFKGEDCFIAEFGTKKYYEDLEEQYLDIKDEVEESLPTGYEATDMAYEPVYENSDDEVFHTEFYNIENPSMPSVVIRIAPDGKRNTLFLRIGKK